MNLKVKLLRAPPEALASRPERPIGEISVRNVGSILSWHHLYNSRPELQMRGRCRMSVSGHCANRALKVSFPEGSRDQLLPAVCPLHSHRGTLATGISSNSMCQEKTREARATDSPKIREEHRAAGTRAGPTSSSRLLSYWYCLRT